MPFILRLLSEHNEFRKNGVANGNDGAKLLNNDPAVLQVSRVSILHISVVFYRRT